MRILWADDQLEIARTLCSSINGLTPHRITFVPDANAALSRVREGFFDLAIIDLAMPPGEWGGLWLLEQLRSGHFRLPVLVLSGEGGQQQTIQALRLGARDYVTKECATTDLAPQIDSVLRNLWDEIHREILTHFPSPLAVSYKRYVASAVAQTRMRTLIDVYEHALRLTGVIGLSELDPEGAQEFSRSSPIQLGTPSMGAWREACRALSNVLPKQSVANVLWRTFDGKNVEGVIKTRNDIAHGSELSERQAQSWLESQDSAFRQWLARIWQRLELGMSFVLSSQFDGKVMTHDCGSLEGESPVLPKIVLRSREPLIAGSVYLSADANAESRLVTLHPLVLVRQGQDLNTWQAHVFDGWRGNRGSPPRGDEALRYIEIWSGTRSDDLGQRVESLPRFIWNVAKQ